MKDFLAKILKFFREEPNFRALFGRVQSKGGQPLTEERIKMYRKRNFFFFLFYPLSLFYMETIFHFALYGEVSVKTLFYLFFFSAAAGFLTNAIALLLPLKLNRIFTLICLAVSTILVESQYIYIRFFKAPYRFSTLGMAGNALTDFWRETLATISSSWFAVVLILIPLIIYIKKKKDYRPAFAPTLALRGYLAIAALVLHLLAVGIISLDNGDFGDRHYYFKEFSATEAVKRFGVLTDMRLDAKVTIFGEGSVDDGELPTDVVDPFATTAPDVTDIPETTEVTEEPPVPIEYGDNVMDIDFEALIASSSGDVKGAHEYFSSLTPTKKNEYTGMFKGKNLIYMTLEGFSYKTIDKERTPTLYKMATEGFVFNNFYTSLWGGSTATGEYTSVTGLFHNSAKCLGWSGDNKMPFTMGNQLSKIGYKTYAFHNHTYSYYSRDLSHPNFGYEYIAIGNGLEGLTSYWPRSDHEMAVATLPYYIDLETPWHAYYMTVSGHANYTFMGNNMAKKHRDIVENMDASDNIKAYHACQYEVELMLAEMVRQLDEKGILEDTVFVMSTDHYPYALSDAELAELYGLPEEGIHKNFDLLRNACIIWSASMEEPIVIDTPCSSLDIIPTVSNLFGIEYDSRLLMGTDVMSGTMPLVILNQDGDGSAWNWINAYGEYSTATKKFTAYEGFSATDEEIAAYVKQMNAVVNYKNKYSKYILNEDYYRTIFK